MEEKLRKMYVTFIITIAILLLALTIFSSIMIYNDHVLYNLVNINKVLEKNNNIITQQKIFLEKFHSVKNE